MVLHALLTILVQLCIGAAVRNWWAGGLLMCGFYLGREITQAEYRWISRLGEGRRANMPWWGGLDGQVWDLKSVLDVALPIVAAILVFLIAEAVRRRQSGAKRAV